MVGLRLFLPESWTDDPERMARARVPEDRRTARTKPEIAIEEIDRVIASAWKRGMDLMEALGDFLRRGHENHGYGLLGGSLEKELEAISRVPSRRASAGWR